MARIYSRNELAWRGKSLKVDRRELARVVPDGKWPNMWRVQLPNGQLTDMVNRTRAKDAALALALATLNREQDGQEAALEPPQSAFSPLPVPNSPRTEITAPSSAG